MSLVLSPVANGPLLGLWLGLAILTYWRAREDREAWAILIPVAVVQVGLLFLGQIRSWNFSEVVPGLEQVISALSAALAILWVMADRLRSSSRALTFLAALILLVLIGMAQILAADGWTLSGGSETSFYVYLLAGPVFLTALGVTLRLGGEGDRVSGFAVRFLISLLITCLAGMTILATAVFAAYVPSAVGIDWGDVVAQAFIVGLALWVVLYAMAVPFILLARRSSFYRNRLFGDRRQRP